MTFTITVKTASGVYSYFSTGTCSATIAMDVYDLFGVCGVSVMPV